MKPIRKLLRVVLLAALALISPSLLVQQVEASGPGTDTCTSPSIGSHPTNWTACVGGTATFVVGASGTASLSYQWRTNGVNLANGTTGTGSSYSGVNSATFQISNVTTADAVSAFSGFYCVVSGQCNPTATSSNAGLTVNTTTPVALIASNNGPICSGGTLMLSVSTVSGATYLWSGPNGFSSSLQNPSVTNMHANNSGTYCVTVANGCLSTQVCTRASFSSICDGIPDWWRAQYFGGDGTTTNGNSCASCNPDLDGASNLQEYLRSTDPTNSLSVNIILYADWGMSDNTYDGYAATITGGHGPKRDIQAAITAALSNDTVQVAAGTYTNTTFNLQGRNITVRPAGGVTVR